MIPPDLIPLIPVVNPAPIILGSIPPPANAECIRIEVPRIRSSKKELIVIWVITYLETREEIVDGEIITTYSDSIYDYEVRTIADDSTPVNAQGMPLMKLDENGNRVPDLEHDERVILGYDDDGKEILLGQLTALYSAQCEEGKPVLQKIAEMLVADFQYQDTVIKRFSKQ